MLIRLFSFDTYAIFATEYLACNVDTAIYQHVYGAEGSQQLRQWRPGILLDTKIALSSSHFSRICHATHSVLSFRTKTRHWGAAA